MVDRGSELLMKLNHELYQKTSGEINVQGKQIDPTGLPRCLSRL